MSNGEGWKSFRVGGWREEDTPQLCSVHTLPALSSRPTSHKVILSWAPPLSPCVLGLWRSPLVLTFFLPCLPAPHSPLVNKISISCESSLKPPWDLCLHRFFPEPVRHSFCLQPPLLGSGSADCYLSLSHGSHLSLLIHPNCWCLSHQLIQIVRTVCRAIEISQNGMIPSKSIFSFLSVSTPHPKPMYGAVTMRVSILWPAPATKHKINGLYALGS